MCIRRREQERIARLRYGSDQLPDDDSGRDDLFLMANTIASDGRPNAIARIIAFADQHCSWLRSTRQRGRLVPHPDAVALAERVVAEPYRMTAERLAARYRLTAAEREALKITTIGAIDMTKAERAARRKRRKVERRKAKRRAAGAADRAVYEAMSASRTKPWEAFGISRRTWERRGKPAPDASVTPTILSLTAGCQTCVTERAARVAKGGRIRQAGVSAKLPGPIGGEGVSVVLADGDHAGLGV